MKNKPKLRPSPDLKLMDQVRQVLRYLHYAYRTEQTYGQWIVRFIRFFDAKIHPKDMGKEEIEFFLIHLASKGNVSAGTVSARLGKPIASLRSATNRVTGPKEGQAVGSAQQIPAEGPLRGNR
jgi:hypothetical protein